MATKWENVKFDVLVKCKRYCCHCHKFCGNNIEVHHIKQRRDGGKDTMENAIPLCFNCHAIIGAYSAKHPKGNKYSNTEIKKIRDEWYKLAENLSRNAILISETDKSLLNDFKNEFTDTLEYIIDTDISSELVKLVLPDKIEDLLRKWNKKTYIFSNKCVEEIKIDILNSLSEFLIYLSPTYLRIHKGSNCLIFRNQSLEEGYRLRDELQPNTYRIRCDLKSQLNKLYEIDG